jgi:hypothetical protein
LWGRALERADAISQVWLKGVKISQQGIKTPGYQRDQQGEWAEKSELSGRRTWLQVWWQGPGGW